MGIYDGYCVSWPDEVKEAWQAVNKLRCQLRCLEANLDHIGYADFENLYDELKRVQQDLRAACERFDALLRRHDPASVADRCT